MADAVNPPAAQFNQGVVPAAEAGVPGDVAMDPGQPAQPVQVVNNAVSMEKLAQARLDMYERKAVQSSITLRLESPDTFSAKKTEQVDRWLFQVEQYLRASNQASDSVKVAYASALLRGDAEKWWEKIVSVAAKLGQDESRCSWVEFKARISQQFQVVNRELKARDALAALVQKGSVSDYASKFITLSFDVSKQ